LGEFEEFVVIEVILNEPEQLAEAGVPEGALEYGLCAGLSVSAEVEELSGFAGVSGVCDQDGAGVP
jgi:hypothetical protein